MDLPNYNLKENPFRIGPAISPEEIIWAGFPELKKEIEKRILFTLKTSSSKIVLNWGRYGSGKTHAANYFTRTNAVNRLAINEKVKPAKSINTILPRTSKEPVQSFLRSFLGKISIASIKKDIEIIKNHFGEEFNEILENISNDIVITKLFYTILDFEFEDLGRIEMYLFGDSSKTILNELNLPFGIKDDEQVMNFISTYINLLTYKKECYSAFILWLDEFEDIDSLTQTQQDRFTTFLRQLFDKTPNNFLLFLNFTPKTFYNIEDLSVTLGEALSTRAKIRIEFDIPNIQAAKDYVYDLINNPLFRNGDKSFIPFEEEAIDFVLNHLGALSARKINEVLSLLIEIGQLEEAEIISKTFIEEHKDELISWED